MSLLSFSYWFHPNLGTAAYDNPKVVTALVISIGLVLLGIAISLWRKKLKNPVTKRLSGSWAGACVWFGLIALVLTVSRAEGIQFLSMRVLWVVWLISIAIYAWIQVFSFRRRHYTVVEKTRVVSTRDQYLPRKKKK